MNGFSSLAVLWWDWLGKMLSLYQMKNVEKSFVELKKLLVTSPVLTIPTSNICYVVYSDASCKSMGCVLMQHGKVVAYASWQLKEYEQNYPTYEVELVVVVFALKLWSIICMARHAKFFIDHKSFEIFICSKGVQFKTKKVAGIGEGEGF